MTTYIQTSLNRHSSMHVRQFEKEYWYKCPKPGCKTTFKSQSDLDEHIRIHENDLQSCGFCPYRYVKPFSYTYHLKLHFNVKDYECDQCDSTFTTQGELNKHYEFHEGITYTCLICKTYEARVRKTICEHLRRKHTDIVGKNFTWGIVKHHVKVNQNLL